ncbi:MAG: DsbA family protein [Proteobacteria bacterium]|nr:DsbA family protein [Pseudomonadota bacterium]
MIRRLTGAAAALALTALPALAFDPAAMTEAERAAFRAEIRAYLLDNPEIIMEAVQVLEGRQADMQAQTDRDVIAANAEIIFEDGYSWVGGNPDGDITIVEFMDYRCGFCRRAVPEVDKLLAADGNIRLVIKEYPILGEQSLLMSRFAIATKQVAGDDAYKLVHETLMGLNGDVTPEALAQVAAELGLDGAAILARLDAPEVTRVIVETRALAQLLNIVVRDEVLRGFLPADQMQMVVDAKREEG